MASCLTQLLWGTMRSRLASSFKEMVIVIELAQGLHEPVVFGFDETNISQRGNYPRFAESLAESLYLRGRI